MTTFFDETDLTTFGKYLLSKERRDLITSNYKEGDNVTLEDRLSQVYDSDLANWKHSEKLFKELGIKP